MQPTMAPSFLTNSGASEALTNANTMSGASVDEIVETEFLIAGAGPAGAALACFLTSYGRRTSSFFFIDSYNILKSSTNYRIGLKGIMVSAAPGTANTPRAHITNMAALGMLRSVASCSACLFALIPARMLTY